MDRPIWAIAISGFAACALPAWAQECQHPAERCDDRPLEALAASTYLTSARADPLCIRVGVDHFRLSIGVADPQIVSVSLPTNGRFLYQDSPVSTITLFDDGTHGDALAGDHVFSLNELSLAQVSGTIGTVRVRFVPMTFVFADAHEEESAEDLGLTLHYVAASVPIPQAVDLAADVRAGGHVVSVAQPLQGSFPGHSVNNRTVARRYYDYFPDDRDFLFIAKVFNTNGNAASFNTVRNDVEGIGLDFLDLSGEYGSAGVLQGVVNVYFGNATPGTLNHELLHRWAAFFDSSLNLTGSGAHWGAIAAGDTGFGGPPAYAGSFDLIESVSGNTYRALVNNSGAFGPLELYVMGLMGLDEVPSPMAALVNPVFQGYEGNYSIYLADALRQVSRADIVAVEGERVPSYATSPKTFRAAMLVVHDRTLSDVELAYYDYAMQEYEKATSSLGMTFGAASGGRGTMSTTLPCAKGTGGPNCASIPAVSDFGLVAAAVLLLGAGAFEIRQRGSGTKSRPRV